NSIPFVRPDFDRAGFRLTQKGVGMSING
ncbi:hypothetical protein CEXT_169871, partial [Caerostris extrusa]